ncbi:right-handed parallel beta-helix repeat-containing protein [Natrinema amylolyticum]|uniref:right-handed parallel beta-helix repeat-containing protein n=1 Tax=Natrinema amylolyticum TaxID=2878679 RepID=UPI001CFA6B7D|nr:right-handed parallel beta-helix repeat-containing protein [Natrinema amylolyticum]
MNRREFVRTAGLVGLAGIPEKVAGQTDGNSADDHDTIRVPTDEPTIQDAVDVAEESDLVLLEEDTYEEAIEIGTPRITLRGHNRNRVILDGGFEQEDGILVEADEVAVENLTVRHFRNNAVYWNDVDGFRGSFLTAYNNGYYGIYAYRSRDGRFEYSYASSHPDAGFYLGRNQPFEAVISDVVAEYNGLGYSGTSTGEDLTIKDSIWRHNMAGIVPNTLDTIDPPQHSSHIVNNVVYDNGNENAPTEQHTYPMFGTGILLWGGNDNLVEDNIVDSHPNFGIAAYPTVDEPSENVIRENIVRGSGRADLALGAPAGEDNQFEANEFRTSLPSAIQDDASEGDDHVTEVFQEQQRRAEDENYPSGNWRDQPEPRDQPTMRDPEAPPRPASKSISWGQ